MFSWVHTQDKLTFLGHLYCPKDDHQEDNMSTYVNFKVWLFYSSVYRSHPSKNGDFDDCGIVIGAVQSAYFLSCCNYRVIATQLPSPTVPYHQTPLSDKLAVMFFDVCRLSREWTSPFMNLHMNVFQNGTWNDESLKLLWIIEPARLIDFKAYTSDSVSFCPRFESRNWRRVFDGIDVWICKNRFRSPLIPYKI